MPNSRKTPNYRKRNPLMGRVEDAVRREVEGNSALAELAYKLAREIDLDAGGVAAVRELRAVLNAYREARGPVYASPQFEKVDHEEYEELPLSEGGVYVYGKPAHLVNGRWVPIETAS
jgi:hypothetical protein